MSAATLYEIAEDYRSCLSMDIDSEEDGEALIGLLDEVEGRFHDKAENVIRFIRNIESTGAMIRVEEVRLAERRHLLEKQQERLRVYLETQMRVVGLERMQAGIFEASFRRNPPKAVVCDETAIPERFWKPQEPVIDKAGIRDALKAGEAVPGAILVQEERLQIK